MFEAWVAGDVPTLNKLLRAHWRVRHAVTRRQRQAVTAVLGQVSSAPPKGALRIVLTRCGTSAKPLDGDNLQGSLKGVRDGVAQWLSRDDADPSLTWVYAQRTRCGLPGAAVTILERGDPEPAQPDPPKPPKAKLSPEEKAERKRQRQALLECLVPAFPAPGERVIDPGVFALDSRTGRGDLLFRVPRGEHGELVGVCRSWDGGSEGTNARWYVSIHTRWDRGPYRARTRGAALNVTELRQVAEALLCLAARAESGELGAPVPFAAIRAREQPFDSDSASPVESPALSVASTI